MSFIICEISFLLSARPAAGLAGTKFGQGDFGRKIALILAADRLGRVGVFLNRLRRPKLRPEAAFVHDRNVESFKRLLSDLAEGADAGQAHPRRNPIRLDEWTRRIRAGAHDVAAAEYFVETCSTALTSTPERFSRSRAKASRLSARKLCTLICLMGRIEQIASAWLRA